MLTLLVPILISFLLDGPKQRTSTKFCFQLHEHSLQWLMRIGPKYPQEFKTLMTKSPDLRMRLEAAIRNDQQESAAQKSKNDAQNAAKSLSQQKPTIQLKTDFSNFS